MAGAPLSRRRIRRAHGLYWITQLGAGRIGRRDRDWGIAFLSAPAGESRRFE